MKSQNSNTQIWRVLLTMLLATAAVSGQGRQELPPTRNPQATFQATTDHIRTHVIVKDNKGQFFSDLRPDEFQVIEDGAARGERGAEVPPEDALDLVYVLDRDWIIQAVFLTDLGYCALAGAWSGHETGRVTRHDVRQPERNQGEPKQDENKEEKPADDQPNQHVRPLTRFALLRRANLVACTCV